MLECNQIEQTEMNWSKLRTEYLAQLPAFLPRCRGYILPGIEALLDRLSQVDHVALGLLTGNLRAGARLKLEHYRLMHHFTFGGYGDEHLDRNDVAQMAIEEAEQHANVSFDRNRVWVIGDTAADFACARAAGVRCLLVATGAVPIVELETVGADAVVPDLTHTDEIFELLIG